MDVEGLILIRGFSKLAICKSRLTVHGAGSGKGSFRMCSKAHPGPGCSLQPQHTQGHFPLFEEMDLLLLWGERGGQKHSVVPPCTHRFCRHSARVPGPHHRELASGSTGVQAVAPRVTGGWARCWQLGVPKGAPGTPRLEMGRLHRGQQGLGHG